MEEEMCLHMSDAYLQVAELMYAKPVPVADLKDYLSRNTG